MADKKISQLTALSAANLAPSTDVLAIVDTSATETKKIVAQDLINGVLNVASAVGIGTASPAQKLDVQGSATDFVAFNGLNTNNNAGTITSSAIKFGFTSTVGTHYATLKITEDSVNSNSGGLTISLPNGGVESPLLTLTSAGNLGIGTTSPGSFAGTVKLVVGSAATTTTPGAVTVYSGNATYGGLYFADGTVGDQLYRGAVEYNHSTDALLFYSSGAERGRFTAGGYFKASNDGTYLNSTASYHELRTNDDNDNVVRLSHTGSLPYGIDVQFTGAAPDNNTNFFLRCEDTGAVRCYIYSDGDLANHDGVYGTISDERLKQDIVDAGSQWDDLKSIRFRKYRMKTDVKANPDAPAMFGVVAQELAQVCPGLVDEHPNMKTVEVTDEEGNVTQTQEPDGTTTMTVKSSILLMKAAKALQEAMARIESLEADVAALKASA